MSEKFKVVISGISGRFPECDRVDTLKEKLYNGGEFITVDDRKWPVGYRYKLNERQIPDATGKLKNYQNFDNVVFKVKQATALSTDITSRLAWEPAFEAIIDAGVNPYSLDGSNVGVFMSLSFSEVSEHAFDDTGSICLLLGSNKTMLSNRLSFALNLKGPSFTNFVDMHGGLESLAMGYKNVSEGFADSAIVGVSSCFKDPRVSLHFIGSGLLSPDGITRAFDESANGYGRSDAIVCFYLQRAEDAKRSYGELKFCDIHYHGSSASTILGCDERHLQTSLEEIYQRNNYLTNLSDIAFVETSAYGFKKMDKVEANGIAGFYNPTEASPLMIGSVKSNLGHTEGAAAFTSVLKALLALDAGILAPNAHISNIHPGITSVKTNKLEVIQKPTKLNGHTVAINAMGLFGSLGHAVIQKNPNDVKSEDDNLPRLLLVSGRVEENLRQVMKKIDNTPYSPEFVALVNDSLGQYLPLHLYRGYTILPKTTKNASEMQVRGAENRPVWLIFSGMGSQWQGMGCGLLDIPVFAETVAKCDKILKPKGIDIYHILTSDDPTMFESILNAFVGITTIQIALFEVLKTLGIKADGMIGHSHGENSCAYADGCLSLEETMLASWTRGIHSIEMNTIKGMMAAVGKGYNDIKDSLPEGVEVACHNSAQSCTLSGPVDKVNSFVNQLKSEGTFAKAVDVANIAYHSSYIASTGEKLVSRLREVIPVSKPRSSKWISTSVPESRWDTELAQNCSAEYLTNNFVNPVLFEEGCRHIPQNAICIEVAPHGLLQAILKKSLPETCTNVPLTKRSTTKENLHFLLSSIGKLYIAGLDVQANNLYPPVNYPVPRGTPSISPFCTWYHDPAEVLPHFLVPNLFFPLSNESIQINIKEDSEHAYLRHHKINDEIIIPPSFFMYLAWWIFSIQRKEKLGSTPIVFENIHVVERVSISLQNSLSVYVMVQHGTGEFEIILDDHKLKHENTQPTVLLTGTISALERVKAEVDESTIPDHATVLLQKDQLYEAFSHSDYQLGEEFRLLQNIFMDDCDYHAEIIWNQNWVTFIDNLIKFQMLAHNEGDVDTLYPKRLRQLKIPAVQFSALEKGTTLICSTNIATKTLQSYGIEMNDLQYKRLVNEQNLRILKYHFIPYANPKCQNVFEFITLCLQIAVESLSMVKTNAEASELTIVDATEKYSAVVKHVINSQNGMKSSVAVYSISDPSLNPKLTTNSLLIVTDDTNHDLTFESNENVFILSISSLPSNLDFKMKNRFIEITKQSFSGNMFTLLQKKRSHNPKFIISYENRELQNGNGYHDEEVSRCIVRKNMELSDIATTVVTRKGHSQKRFVYVLDAETDMDRLNKSIEHLMQLNLPALVLKQGEWGSYRNLSMSSHQESNEKSLYAKLISSIANFNLGLQETAYVSVYNENFDDALNQPTIGFSYAGVANSEEKVMGLGKTFEPGCAERDPYLCWRVPKEWSMEDAVSVPFIYAQAYSLIHPFMKRPVRVKSALINMGKEYLLTEAFVTLCMHLRMEVFVTVASNEEAELIKRKFPKLEPKQILRPENQSYELEILRRTKGAGLDVVVNCLPGVDNLAASLNCAALAGFCIELGSQNCDFSNELGLYGFIKSRSFLMVPNKASDLLALPCEKKIKLKNFIQSCIDNGIIVPPNIRQYEAHIQSEIYNTMKILKCISPKKMPRSTSSPVNYDEKHSYLIIGEKSDACLEVLEWLIAKGARKFIVCLEMQSQTAEISRQIKRLQEQTRAVIVLTSLSKLDEIENTRQLYEETRKIAPLEAVFFVSIKTVSGQFSNLEMVVPSNVLFVGFSSGRLNDYESRRAKGSPAVLIHGDKLEKLSTLFPHLDDHCAVDTKDGSSALMSYKLVEKTTTKRRERKNFALREYLPADVVSLSGIVKNSTSETGFLEVTSLSRRYRSCKGVYPIFMLPALHADLSQPLYQRLQYPVFSAVNVNLATAPTTARKLFQSLSAIQPTGPVTLISEMWNLPITLDLVSQIEKAGRKYKVFALDGNPRDWNERITSCLGSTQSIQDLRLVDEIFHFVPDASRCHKQELTSFEGRIRACAEKISSDNEVVGNIVEAAKVIRDKISCVTRLQFDDKILSNFIMFERKPPDDNSLKLSITSDVVVLEEPNYWNLLTNPKTCATINENAAFDWWEFPEINS